jgi:hypothetical protein
MINKEEVMAVGTQCICKKKNQKHREHNDRFHKTIKAVPHEYNHDTKGPGYHRQPPHPYD